MSLSPNAHYILQYRHKFMLPDFGAAPAGHGGQEALKAGLTVGPIVLTLRQQDARVGLLNQQYLSWGTIKGSYIFVLTVVKRRHK